MAFNMVIFATFKPQNVNKLNKELKPIVLYVFLCKIVDKTYLSNTVTFENC